MTGGGGGGGVGFGNSGSSSSLQEMIANRENSRRKVRRMAWFFNFGHILLFQSQVQSVQ